MNLTSPTVQIQCKVNEKETLARCHVAVSLLFSLSLFERVYTYDSTHALLSAYIALYRYVADLSFNHHLN